MLYGLAHLFEFQHVQKLEFEFRQFKFQMVFIVVGGMFLDAICLDIVRGRKIDDTRLGERQTICQHGLGWGIHGTKDSCVLIQSVFSLSCCKSRASRSVNKIGQLFLLQQIY